MISLLKKRQIMVRSKNGLCTYMRMCISLSIHTHAHSHIHSLLITLSSSCRRFALYFVHMATVQFGIVSLPRHYHSFIHTRSHSPSPSPNPFFARMTFSLLHLNHLRACFNNFFSRIHQSHCLYAHVNQFDKETSRSIMCAKIAIPADWFIS